MNSRPGNSAGKRPFLFGIWLLPFILGVVLFSVSLTLLPAAVAQQQDQETTAREALLRQAIENIFAASSGEEFKLDEVRIENDWALATVRSEMANEEMPRVRLVLAHWGETQWKVVLADQAEYRAWLDQLPEALISKEARRFLLDSPTTAASAPGLWLPFPAGQTWRFLAGPFGGPKRESVAFGPIGPYETPEPPPEANLTGRERTVTAAAAGTVVLRDRNLVIIQHSGFPAFQTGYFSLASASIPVKLFDLVEQGQTIGYASQEGNLTLADHVQFWVRRENVDEPIEPQILSDWRIFRDNGYRAGPKAGRIVYRNGSEIIDCASLVFAPPFVKSCQVHHFSPVTIPAPFPPIIVALSSPPMIPVADTDLVLVNAAGAENIYRMELGLSYDPNYLVVVDAYPDTPEVEIAPGEIFTNTPIVIEENRAISTSGTIRLTVSMQPPGTAFTGAGTLARIALHRIAPSTTTISITQISLFDSNGYPLAVSLPVATTTILSAHTLQGQVFLQGRSDHSRVAISVGDYETQSDVSGAFSIGTRHNYALNMTTPSYLSGRIEGFSSGIDYEVTMLPPLILPAGDVNGDDRVNIVDLVTIAGNFGQNVPRVDLNQDGMVDIVDLSLVADNFGRRGPVGPNND